MLTSRSGRLAQLSAPFRPWWRFFSKEKAKKETEDEDEEIDLRPVGQQNERGEEEGERGQGGEGVEEEEEERGESEVEGASAQ
jgi:hypothetical protein